MKLPADLLRRWAIDAYEPIDLRTIPKELRKDIREMDDIHRKAINFARKVEGVEPLPERPIPNTPAQGEEKHD